MQPSSSDYFDKPHYTNTQMPWDPVAPEVPALNPTGNYERYFEIPSSWDGKRIVLHLGGYESVALITVNGVQRRNFGCTVIPRHLSIGVVRFIEEVIPCWLLRP